MEVFLATPTAWQRVATYSPHRVAWDYVPGERLTVLAVTIFSVRSYSSYLFILNMVRLDRSNPHRHSFGCRSRLLEGTTERSRFGSSRVRPELECDQS